MHCDCGLASLEERAVCRIVHHVHVISNVVVQPELRTKPTLDEIAHRVFRIGYPAIELAKLRRSKLEIVVINALLRAEIAFAFRLS